MEKMFEHSCRCSAPSLVDRWAIRIFIIVVHTALTAVVASALEGNVTTVTRGFSNTPHGIAFDTAGNLFVSLYGGQSVSRIDVRGAVTTFSAGFTTPTGLAFDSAGTLFVADYTGHWIGKIGKSGGSATPFVGFRGYPGQADGVGQFALFYLPFGLAFDSSGVLFVGDAGNMVIRAASSDGTVTTYAGVKGMRGTTDGFRTEAKFNQPFGLAFDASGNLFVDDFENSAIRKIDVREGVVSTVAGFPSRSGSADGVGQAAEFNHPRYIAFDSFGVLFVSDFRNHAIRCMFPNTTVITVAGKKGEGGFVDGVGVAARFSSPAGIAFDTAGFLFVSDTGNNAIRKISLGDRKVLRLAATDTPTLTATVSGGNNASSSKSESGSVSGALTNSRMLSQSITVPPQESSSGSITKSVTAGLFEGTPSMSLLPTASTNVTDPDPNTALHTNVTESFNNTQDSCSAPLTNITNETDSTHSSSPATKVLATLMSREASEAVATVGSLSTVGSGLVTPTAATQFARVGAALRSILCVLSDAEDASASLEHPFVLPLGGEAYPRYAGACLCSTLLVLLFQCVHWVLGHTSRRAGASKIRLSAVTISGIGMPLVAAYFLPNIAGAASVVLNASHRSGAGAAVAVLGLCTHCVVLGWPLYATLQLSSYVKWSSDRAEANEANVERTGKIDAMFEVLDPASFFVESCGKYFDEAKDPDSVWCRLLFFEEVIVSSVCSFLSGIRPPAGSCLSVLIPILILSAAHLLYVATLRPYNRFMSNAFSLLSALVIVAICVIGLFVVQDASKMEWLAYPLLLQNTIFFVQAAVTGIWAYVRASRRTVLRRQADAVKLSRSLLGDDDDDDGSGAAAGTSIPMAPRANPLQQSETPKLS